MAMISAPPSGIKRFAVVWIAGILFFFTVVTFSWFVTTSRLQNMSGRVFTDAQSLEADHLFELEILRQRREDLLWRLTNEEDHRRQRDLSLSQADKLIGNLRANVTSPEETVLVQLVEAKYGHFRAMAQSDPPQTPERLAVAVGELLDVLHSHRDLNTAQMQNTVAASKSLGVMVGRLSIGLVVVTLAILAAGAAVLWSRIFRPTILLARAAEAFGQGNKNVHAQVLRDDEMGALSRTFNDMAEAIYNRERERRDFVATVAHDTKVPVAVISMTMQQIEDEGMPAAKMVRSLGIIKRNVRHMQVMLDDLMDTIQVETGQPLLHREELDLSVLAGEIVREQAEVWKTYGLHFEGDDHCRMIGDPQKLERVILNLLSNAIKYSPRGSNVVVTVETHGATAVLSVRDEGVGIAPQDLEQIFLPFKRLDKTRGMTRGVGIGLTSAKRIVEAHGGSVHVSSEVDVGTTVEVHLPLFTTATNRAVDRHEPESA
jgi:signal transduction histidine kinase